MDTNGYRTTMILPFGTDFLQELQLKAQAPGCAHNGKGFFVGGFVSCRKVVMGIVQDGTQYQQGNLELIGKMAS